MKKKSRRQSAAAAYRQGSQQVRFLVDWLMMHLNDLDNRQAANPRDWGFPGDLAAIERALLSVLPEDTESVATEIVNGGCLPKALREELETWVAESDRDGMFGDGLEMEYVYDGVHIVGVKNMSDLKLIESIEQRADAEDPDCPATEIGNRARAALEKKS